MQSIPLSDDEVASLRAATPGCQHIIHLNTAGAGLCSAATLHAMHQHLVFEGEQGAMEAGAHVDENIAVTRRLAAQVIGADASEIALLSSGSDAWGKAFAALPQWRPGDRVFVSRQEWGSNLANIQIAAARTGAHIEVMPCCEDGSVDVAALSNMFDHRVKLVALTWLPANGGLINDAAAIGQMTRSAGVPYFVDAGQAVGQLPVDVRAIGCDVLKSSGRKHLRGPRGTAILYVRKVFLHSLTPSYFDVHAATIDSSPTPTLIDSATRFESLDNIAAIIGLKTALEQVMSVGIERAWQRVQRLARWTRNQMSDVKHVALCDLGSPNHRSGLISFNLDQTAASQVKALLRTLRINIGANGVSYTPLDMQARRLTEVARLSISYLTTEDELAMALQAIAAIASAK
jgi:cysteine desulfurase / selenocysteine lyase